jgi:hypothetical protein
MRAQLRQRGGPGAAGRALAPACRRRAAPRSGAAADARAAAGATELELCDAAIAARLTPWASPSVTASSLDGGALQGDRRRGVLLGVL